MDHNDGLTSRCTRRRPMRTQAAEVGGVRGKYAKRFREGTTIVLINPEMVEAFPTEAAVNEAPLPFPAHTAY